MHTLGFFNGKLTTSLPKIMKAKTILFAFTILLFSLLLPIKSHAQEIEAGSSATFHSIVAAQQTDNRVRILKSYLEQFHSPLAPYAANFVAQADLYNVDWRFVAAIAGRESTFAKQEPCINPFGYGIYGNTMTCFASYPQAIQTVSKALRENYIDKWGAQNVYDIGHMYAASPTWASGVIYFMNDIQRFALAEPQPLPISL